MANRREMLRQVGGAMALAMTSGLPGARAEDKPRPRIKVGQIGVGHAHARYHARRKKRPQVSPDRSHRLPGAGS